MNKIEEEKLSEITDIDEHDDDDEVDKRWDFIRQVFPRTENELSGEMNLKK